ncbi:monooxygenase [Coprinopsis marcescibilis]|uniref:Monooxygenase n=1 Tax=Coprinopsis marcescibilis TaxID=230819 RepID=A0A5C3KKM0_COPMA|nr:monooxygenase [Coprinopsis marcescibilis]
MSGFPPIPNTTLPTFSVVGTTLPLSFDASTFTAQAVAEAWVSTFCTIVAGSDAQDLVDLFVPASTGAQVWWRDMLALTWDFRTFIGHDAIAKFAADRLTGANAREEVGIRDLELDVATASALPPTFTQATPDLAWLQFFFKFKTKVSDGSGIVRIVPVGVTTLEGLNDARNWKAHMIFTNLEGLVDHPEAVGRHRNPKANHGLWSLQREKEVECAGEDGKPTVVILGAGQSGLGVAARLKVLGLKSLLVDQNERVGDNWRNRYEALCLHDPVWYDHMPYLPFPPNWPTFTPATKLANWLEHYADIMELNVWMSSTIEKIIQDSATGFWDITILRRKKKGDGSVREERRRFEGIHHVIMATGLGSGLPEIPSIPGIDKFKANGGLVLHSSQHKRAGDHRGKKVVVVGACTSAHDITADYYHNGVDVTMYQRSSTYIMSTENGWKVLMEGVYSENAPPVEVADKLNSSFPHLAAIPLNQMKVGHLAQLDKDLLDRLNKVGFRTNLGIEGTGFGLLAWSRAGGYYFDTGASGLIIDGKIKLKGGGGIKELTEKGLLFEDGSSLDADVVLFATGIGDTRKRVQRLLGDENLDVNLWGLDDEGELRGAYRDLGVKRMWYMIGNLALARFHSKHLALQIKAVEEGLFPPERYSM